MQNTFVRNSAAILAIALGLLPAFAADPTPIHRGYYTSPAIRGDNIVFTSEGDLWEVAVNGGVARRLTTNPGTESNAVLSADGKTVCVQRGVRGAHRGLHHAGRGRIAAAPYLGRRFHSGRNSPPTDG